jgi:hypothetical protein
VWDAAERSAEAAGGVLTSRLHDENVEGNLAERRLDFGRIKHNEIEVFSLIRESLWEQAGWSATLFLTFEDDSELPALAPTFMHAGPAGAIFAELRKEIGMEDSKETLRIAIIRGIDKEQPHAYRVVIGTNAQPGIPRADGKLLFMLFRVHTMIPASDENLERFLRSYQRTGTYYLIHGVMRGGVSEAEPIWDNCILKKELIVKHAWEVGKNDPDSAGIQEDDDPIIPAGQANAPILELIAWRRQRAAQAQ